MTTADTAPTASEALDRYSTWLEQQPLAARTRATYLAQARQYLGWAQTHDNFASLLPDHTGGMRPAGRAAHKKRQKAADQVTWAVGSYKQWLLTTRGLAKRTVNLALAAVHSFYLSRGLDIPTEPERILRQAPRALKPAQVKALRRVASGLAPRDRAIVLTLLNTGLRRAELAALRTGDVAITPRKGLLTVRSGKGGRSRTVPLNAECRRALQAWISDRPNWRIRDGARADALWLSRVGNQISGKAVGSAVRAAGIAASIEGLTPHTLRHTFVTGLVRGGADPFLVADLAGHARLETTLLYSLPSDDDRRRAVEDLVR